jgi:iron complex transport system substrate-binding protein
MRKTAPRFTALFFFLLLCGGARAATPAQNVRTLVDDLGRSVAFPAEIKRVLSLQPEITRLIVALGAGDRLVGIDHFLRAEDPLFRVIAPGLERLPLVSMADYNVNMEIVLRLAPEAIFGAPEDKAVVEALQSKTGIPTIALSSQGRFDHLLEEMKLLGSVLGRGERAAELMAYFRSELESVRKAVRTSSEPKPRVYLAFWGSPTRTPVHYDPVDAAGGVNVAENLLPTFLGTLIANVNFERILDWNPDVILVHGNYPVRKRAVTTAQFLSDGRLRTVSAVRDRRVRYTFGFWNWWDPAEVLVETAYLARLFHPGLFPARDWEAEADAVFKKFYGVDGAFAALSDSIGCGGWPDGR